mmetsp:Transcript_31597/g.35840  ORF Transcript_31597/g.35840 Transcript_31597/m.35840 type:complete len:347 (-) Transcript_31597:112-1152(-)
MSTDFVKTIPITKNKNKKSEDNKNSEHGVVDTTTVVTSCNRFVLLNVVFYLLNVLVTSAVQFGGIAALPTTSTVSAKYHTIVTPCGPASLALWGLIFFWQLCWVLGPVLVPSQRNNEGVVKVWYYYPIMTVLQAGWTISFAKERMVVAALFMYGMLLTLLLASLSLQTYTKNWQGYLLWQAPISLHTGWSMAASAVMTNVVIVAIEDTPASKLIVATLTLAIVIVTSFVWLTSYPVDFAIPCVIFWALGGMYAELDTPQERITAEFTTIQIKGVRTGVLAGMILIGIGIVSKIIYVCAIERPAAQLQAQAQQREQQQNKEQGQALLQSNNTHGMIDDDASISEENE